VGQFLLEENLLEESIVILLLFLFLWMELHHKDWDTLVFVN